MSRGAIVVIGRNEGERLRVSIGSAVGRELPVLYVDSGSRDGSPELARSLGCEVLELDASRPFSAARGRNEGFEAAARRSPAPEWLQFLDGDCELAPEWLASGSSELERHPEAALVSGKLREQNPGATIYNRLCQMEWEGFPGKWAECGGNMLVRTAAFHQVRGFDAGIPAGEELDFCYRIKGAGWKILNLNRDMATHDAAMTRFGQWWTRTVRGGEAYALVAVRHGGGTDRYAWRPNLSILAWGLILPLVAVGASWPTSGWSLLLLGAYPVQAARIAWGRIRRGNRRGDAWLYAVFTVLGKLPQMLGQVRFAWRLMRRKTTSRLGGSNRPVEGKVEALEKPQETSRPAEPGSKR